jgi:stage II sporulation protein M
MLDTDQTAETIPAKPQKTQLWLYIVLAAVIFIVSVALGFVIPNEVNVIMGNALESLQESAKVLASLGPVTFLIVIFLNNAIKCLLIIVLGVILCLPPVIFVCFNAALIGALAAFLGTQIGYTTVVAGLLPHGIIEIPALLVSAALGLSIGVEVWKMIFRQRSRVKEQLKYGLRIYARWLILALLVAAIIEVFVTPLIVSATGVKVPF